MANRLLEEEHERILLTCNSLKFAVLTPGQIVPILTDRSPLVVSERSLYRVLYAHGQADRCALARPIQKPRAVPSLRAAGPNQVSNLDTTYFPTTVRGIRVYLYLVIAVYVYSRKGVAWDDAKREELAIVTELVSRAYLRKRIIKGIR